MASLLAALLLFSPGEAALGAQPGGFAATVTSQQAGPDEGEGDGRLLLRRALEEQVEALDLEQMERFYRLVDPELQRELGPIDLRGWLFGQAAGDPGGEGAFSLTRIGSALARRLLAELLLQSRLLVGLVVLAVAAGLLQQLGKGLIGRGAGDVAFAVVVLALLAMALQSFRAAASIAAEAIDTMVAFVHALLPTLSGLLAAAGAVSTAVVFHPVLISASTVTSTLIRDAVLPLAYLSVALGLVGQLSPELSVSRLAQLSRQLAVTLLGLLLTIFLGVLAVRGAIAPVVDGVTLRTAKFVTGAFVPIIGGMLSDAVEVVAGSSLLLKNAAGAAGLVLLLLLMASPLLKIASVVVIFRLATALVQPISDSRLADGLSSLADSLTLLLVSLAAASVLFFVGITVVVGAGNLPAMLR